MEQFNQNHTRSASLFSRFHFCKKVIQILVSSAVFFFLFCYTPLLHFLLNSFNNYMSRFSMKLFNCTTERNYMFLLCNGILVFVIKSSGLVHNSPFTPDLQDNYLKRNTQQSIPKLLETKAVDNTIGVAIDVEEEKNQNRILVAVKGGDKMLKQDEDEAEQNDQFLDKEEEAEDGSDELLSIEDLNKKCEDFIRKMKEGLKFDSHQTDHGLIPLTRESTLPA